MMSFRHIVLFCAYFLSFLLTLLAYGICRIGWENLKYGPDEFQTVWLSESGILFFIVFISLFYGLVLVRFSRNNFNKLNKPHFFTISFLFDQTCFWLFAAFALTQNYASYVVSELSQEGINGRLFLYNFYLWGFLLIYLVLCFFIHIFDNRLAQSKQTP